MTWKQVPDSFVFERILFIEDFKNKKGPETNFPATFFVAFLDKYFSIVILHKLVKFH